MEVLCLFGAHFASTGHFCSALASEETTEQSSMHLTPSLGSLLCRVLLQLLPTPRIATPLPLSLLPLLFPPPPPPPPPFVLVSSFPFLLLLLPLNVKHKQLQP